MQLMFTGLTWNLWLVQASNSGKRKVGTSQEPKEEEEEEDHDDRLDSFKADLKGVGATLNKSLSFY